MILGGGSSQVQGGADLREPVPFAGAELCLCSGSRPALSRELGWRCSLRDSGEQNAGAAHPPNTCGTPRGRKAPAGLMGMRGWARVLPHRVAGPAGPGGSCTSSKAFKNPSLF